MIAGLPTMVFWGIIVWVLGTGLGTFMIQKGARDSMRSHVTDEAESTRIKVDDSKNETINEIKKVSTDPSGIKYIMNKFEDWTEDSSNDDWEEWRTNKKILAESLLKLELSELSSKEKGLLINFLYKGDLLGNNKTLRNEQRKVKGDKEKVYSKYWTHVPVNLAYLDFNNAVFNESIWINGAFLSFMNLNAIKTKNYSFALKESFLQSTSFTKATLIGSDFSQSKLLSTRWAGAILKNANFTSADLRGATFSTWLFDNPKIFIVEQAADLEGANFKNANLKGALISANQLKKVKSLEGATMPNGNKYDSKVPLDEQVLEIEYINIKQKEN
jgi:uncharacterized protein YjbI with pentapeptide repeats